MTTYYARDVQGNVISVYDNQNGTINWREQHLYSSSRLGMWKPDVNLATANGSSVWNQTGRKFFELSNHLGNVLAVISDRRVQSGSEYLPVVASAQDYYPGGMIQPGRSFSSGSYRYGFNGQERDNEIKGDGNSIEFKERIYDPRVQRFLSVDPIAKELPWNTPYAFAENRPIDGVDLEGLEYVSVNGNPVGPLNEAYARKIGASLQPGFKSESQIAAASTQQLLQKHGRSINSPQGSIKAYDLINSRPDIRMNYFIGQGIYYGLANEGMGIITSKALGYTAKGMEYLMGGTKLASLYSKSAALIPTWASRFSIADKFYKAAGYADDVERLSHMRGIDLTKSVEEVTLTKGTVVNQWVGKRGVGSYFTNAENTAQNLGISYEGRTLKQFTLTEDVKVLRSTAATFDGAAGGGTQYFNPSLKNSIKEVATKAP